MTEPSVKMLFRKVSMLIASGMNNAQITTRMVEDYGPGSLNDYQDVEIETLEFLFDTEMLQSLRQTHRDSGKSSKYDRRYSYD